MAGEADVIRAAVDASWVAGALVVLIFGMATLFVFIIKWSLNTMNKRNDEATRREEALGRELSAVKSFIQDKFVDLSSKATTAITESVKAQETAARVMGLTCRAMERLAEAIGSRPCLQDFQLKGRQESESVIV